MNVMDASALLAFLFKEQGHEAAGRLLDGSLISAVNFSEVVGRFVRDGHDARTVEDRLCTLRMKIEPFGQQDATIAAELLPATLPLGLSLADRACLALALRKKLPAVTADRAWGSLDLAVPIKLIRGS